MTTVTFKGNPITTLGQVPAMSHKAPDFTLTNSDLEEIESHAFQGHKVVLNIFPSLDTQVCANSVRTFNQRASDFPDVKILCISQDLPFAHSRFCAAENIQNVTLASGFRHPEFGETFGVTISSLPLKGLYARTVILLDAQGRVQYIEQVPEITYEPDYDKALATLAGI